MVMGSMKRGWIPVWGLLAGLMAVCSAHAQTESESPRQRVPVVTDKAHYRLPPEDASLPGVGPLRRYDWFAELWQNRRWEWAQSIEQDQGAVVFLGDSITQGWGPLLAESFPSTRVANRGISGDTTRGMLIRLQEDVLALQPAGVVVLAGTNDLEERADPEQIAQNLGAIIQQIQQWDSSIPIVLCLVFPSSASRSRSSEDIQKINQLYRKTVKGNPQVTVVDTWTLFADDQGDAVAELFPDRLHLNEAGYRQWAKALRPFLEHLKLVSIPPDENQRQSPDEGFRWLFNGSNLDGWSYQPSSQADREAYEGWKRADPNAPEWPMRDTAFSHRGLTVTPDGRYQAENGRLTVTYPPSGRKIQQIWADEILEGDFTLRLEFRASPNADSGVFVCGRQLQCRDYPRAGPYKDLQSFNDLDWNRLEIVVRNGLADCTCNGQVIESGWEVPESGRIGLEGDRGQVEYRRIQIRTR